MVNFQKQLEKKHGKKNITTVDLWEDDTIQFPRLISELEAVGAFTPEVIKKVAQEMDLDIYDIINLLERANKKFDKIKRGLK